MPGQLHAAGQRRDLLGGQLLGFAQRLVDRGHDQVFERLDVFGVDRFGRDLDPLDLGLGRAHADFGDRDGHRAAARRGFDRLVARSSCIFWMRA